MKLVASLILASAAFAVLIAAATVGVAGERIGMGARAS